jgi:uncharacterized protein YuzE
MNKLNEILPTFTAEVKKALSELDREDLIEMIPDLTLDNLTYDPKADAFYLYTGGTRSLNVVERNIIGVKHGKSIELKMCSGIVVLDTDNFGRISGIEIINRKDVYEELRKINAF